MQMRRGMCEKRRLSIGKCHSKRTKPNTTETLQATPFPEIVTQPGGYRDNKKKNAYCLRSFFFFFFDEFSSPALFLSKDDYHS